MLEKKKKQTGKKESKAARQGHDMIVIGASAGGVEALVDLVGQFPPDLPASVFIVLHVAPYLPSTLPDILSKAGPLPASHAVHGEPIERGHIYVAPPDSHMTLQEGSLRVVRGPKENGHRPAVDPLFRTAARRYRSRVIGVVLTGALDCGTAGLMAIKSFGGLAVVQDPTEALYSDMPRSAIDHVKVDHVVSISGMGALLARLAGEPAEENGAESAPKMNRGRENEEGKENKKLSSITCPECNGSLTETEDGGLLRFECHVGHVYTEEAMVAEQAHALETALWIALRSLEESELLARRMAGRSVPGMAARFTEKANAMKQHASVIRNFLVSGEEITPRDASSNGGMENSRGFRLE